MARIVESNPDTRNDLKDLPVLAALQLANGFLTLLHGVQGLHAFPGLAAAVFGIALGQVGRIGQQDGDQFTAGFLCIDRSAVATFDQ